MFFIFVLSCVHKMYICSISCHKSVMHLTLTFLSYVSLSFYGLVSNWTNLLLSLEGGIYVKWYVFKKNLSVHKIPAGVLFLS